MGCSEGLLILFDSSSEDGRVVDSHSHSGQGITSLTVSVNHLISSCRDGYLRFFDLDSLEIVKQVTVANDSPFLVPLLHAALLADSSAVLVTAEDGSLYKYPLTSQYLSSVGSTHFKNSKHRFSKVCHSICI